MKNTKRILALILAVLMLFASSACTGTIEPDEKDEENTVIDVETEKPTDTDKTSAVIPETEGETTVIETEQAITTAPEETTKIEEPTNEYEIYSIGEFCNVGEAKGIAVISTSAGYGYLNRSGKVRIEPIYEEAYAFNSEGVALVKKDGKYGYIDHNGHIVIDTKYDKVEKQFDDSALVSLNGVSYYIYAGIYGGGSIIYTVTGDEVAIGEPSNGYIWVQTKEELISGTKYYLSYYDYRGECIAKIENGRPCVHNGVDYSAVNKEESMLLYLSDGLRVGTFQYAKYGLPFSYGPAKNVNGSSLDIPNIKPFLDNYFMYQHGWNIDYYYLDYQTMAFKLSETCNERDNTSWIPLDNDYFYRYRHNWLDATDPYNPVIVYKDKVIIELDKISAFSSANVQGVAHMYYNNRNYFGVHLKSASDIDFYALIDDTSKVVIQPTNDYRFMYSYTETYDYITFKKYELYSFETGYCKAQDTKTGLWGFIDINGNWVIKPQYNKVSDFTYNGYDYHAIVDDKSVINNEGKEWYNVSTIKR